MGSSLQLGPFLRPHYSKYVTLIKGTPKRDPNLEIYPYTCTLNTAACSLGTQQRLVIGTTTNVACEGHLGLHEVSLVLKYSVFMLGFRRA